MSDRQRLRRLTPARRLGLLAAAAAAAIAVPTTAVAAGPPAPRAAVAPELAALAPQETTQFLVYLRERANLSGAARQANSDARVAHVYQQLTSTATRSQQGVVAVLDEAKVQYKQFWIANVISVKGGKSLIDALAKRPDVERIDLSTSKKLIVPTATKAEPAPAAGPEWGLANVGAPQVWSQFGVRGEGIVVANIDTGVQYNHPALAGKYRGNLGNGQFDHNYNWFDPSDVCANPSVVPCDNNGHGTHTMGTMVGDDGAGNQVGVAPGAKWIAAKGCEANSPLGDCSTEALLAAGEWVVAPTDLNGQNPRTDLHADIVNNSWGGDGGDLWYQQTVDSWIQAGIFPSFAAGNSGPGCNTAESPGDYPESYAVGGFDINNNIYNNSSRGTSSIDGGIKPNISAPAVAVRSSVPNNTYSAFTGTSMATPHVSGTVALIWSAAPTLKGDIDATKALLNTTATDVNATTCGGTAADNNMFGEGRLNALAAVTAAPRGNAGRVVGAVTNASTGAPIAGATVSSGTTSTVTGADGGYGLPLTAGEQTVTASMYGFASQSATVTVPEGAVVTQNFALTPQPTVTVSGRVRDGSGNGYPLYAKIEVAGRPGDPIFTNPATGQYSFQASGNTTYKLTVQSKYSGYRTVTEDLVVGGANLTHDIAVPIDVDACTARGYAPGFEAPILTEPFNDTTAPPPGWSVANRTTTGGWQFDDPGDRGNQTGGSGGFAMLDSDFFGTGMSQDSDLITPPLDLTGLNAPQIVFNSDYRSYSNGFVDVDVSTDGGTTWTTMWHQTSPERRHTEERVSLAPGAGKADVRVRFRYSATFAWWWEVDDVRVVNRTCVPVDGGLVVGFVTDKNTGAALDGATVTSDAAPADKATTAATPDDPNIGDGFYSLYSTLVGSRSFTATKSPYTAVTKSVAVAENGTTKADFPLTAGQLTVSPNSVTGHVPFGQSKSTTFTVKNTGSAPTSVEVLERSGSFEILNRAGSDVVSTPIPGGAAKGKLAGSASGGSVKGMPAPRADDAWKSIANYPTSTFDLGAATVNGKVYAFGNSSATAANSAFVYDPEANGWTALPALPHPRAKPQVANVNDKLYVFGGWATEGIEASVDVFDPGSNSWSTVAGATNPAPRAAAGVAVVNSKVYLVGGCADDFCASSTDLVIFDPGAGRFSTGKPYPQSVAWMSCGGIGSQAYCAGGADASSYLNGFTYNPASNTWSAIADLPLDLWGSADTTANGMLVLMGGVTDNAVTVTNRTVGYDPSTNKWVDLPNAGFARYRGAGACGIYKIAGAITRTTPSDTAEHLGGLDNCIQSSDVPWLTPDPTTFTLNPGQSRTVKVTLSATAAAKVTQPGTYTAELVFRTDTPYPVGSVAVTMNVLPPANWAKVTGTVLGQSCTGDPAGLAATIRLSSVNSPDIGYSVKANAQGRFDIWVPAGRYDVIVAKDEYVPQVRRVKLDAGFVLTHNVTLAPFAC